jgi:hypothetical protein
MKGVRFADVAAIQERVTAVTTKLAVHMVTTKLVVHIVTTKLVVHQTGGTLVTTNLENFGKKFVFFFKFISI